MSLKTWGRRLAVAGGVLGGIALSVYAYHRLAPARFLVEARLAGLASGERILVVEEVVGSSLRSRQSLRFDCIDSATGERRHRLLAPLGITADRLRFLGGGVRQWWGKDEQVLLLDAAACVVVADGAELVARNPSLRGELHRSGSRDDFGVDENGALLASGGDGRAYVIDNTALVAILAAAGNKRVRVEREPELPRRVSETANFTAPRSTPEPGAPLGELMKVCLTTTAGPCTLRSQLEGQVSWQLGDAELDGNSVISVEAHDARQAYVYTADDAALASLYGGAWLYAVELSTGRVNWRRKL